MKVIIPLAGRATRLRPQTHTTPKALLHVAGKPLIEHVFDSLTGLEVSEYIFITGYLGEKVESYMAENHPKFVCTYIKQKTMNGPGAAIHLARKHITEQVLIVYVDTIFEADLDAIPKLAEKYDGVLWAQEVEDYQRFGVIVTGKDETMTKIIEKPSEPISKLANIGVYYLHDYKLFLECLDKMMAAPPHKKGEYFLTDVFQYMVDAGSKLRVEPVHGWYDCGQHNTMLETNAIILEKQEKKLGEGEKSDAKMRLSKPKESVIIPPVYLGKNCTIVGSVIGPNVSIADGVTITSSIIRESIVDEGSCLKHAVLENSVLGKNVQIEGKAKGLFLGDDTKLFLD